MTEWTVKLKDRVIQGFLMTEGKSVIIGRGKDADVTIDNAAISRHHARFEYRNGIYLLTDLGSLNGTFINGKKIEATVPLTESDMIEIGKFQITAETSTEQHGAIASLSTPDDFDATVFVSAKKQDTKSALLPGEGIVSTKHRLILVNGRASVSQLILDGKSSIKIGKDPSCTIQITGWLVKAAHCYIVSREDKYFVVPQPSWIGGTKLNGTKIKDEHRLHKGDLLQIGKTTLRFE